MEFGQFGEADGRKESSHRQDLRYTLHNERFSNHSPHSIFNIIASYLVHFVKCLGTLARQSKSLDKLNEFRLTTEELNLYVDQLREQLRQMKEIACGLRQVP